MSDDIEISEPAIREPHEWKKRRRTVEDWVTLAASWVAILAATGGALGWMLDAVPFVKAQTYAVDKAAFEGRVTNLEGQFKTISSSVDSIQRNGILTLQLQLKARVDLLSATLRTTSQGSPQFFGLQAELNATQQQLDEVTRQLNR